jgi:hypothetical protein
MNINKKLRAQADERYHAKREWLDRVGAPLASESAAFEHGFDAAWKLITPLLPKHEDAHQVQNDGISVIAAERRRQIESEGWSAEDDDKYEIHELACAAACYVVPAQFRDPLTIMAELWPWDESWWKPGDRIRELA